MASGEANNLPMLRRMITTGLPIFLSTGMSPLNEIDTAVGRVQASGSPLAVFQCTTAYPCPPDKIGLNLIEFLRERYGCTVGLSDHSGTIYAGLAAATMGVDVIEVHITLSREMFGPDVPASVTTAELRQLVKGIRFIEEMKANPIDKDEMAVEMAPLRDLFTKSIVARTDLPAGIIVGEENLALKKPGTGIAADHLPDLLGRRLLRDVKKDDLLKEEDLEAVSR
jgi:N-acetylneuraminate synthase